MRFVLKKEKAFLIFRTLKQAREAKQGCWVEAELIFEDEELDSDGGTLLMVVDLVDAMELPIGGVLGTDFKGLSYASGELWMAKEEETEEEESGGESVRSRSKRRKRAPSAAAAAATCTAAAATATPSTRLADDLSAEHDWRITLVLFNDELKNWKRTLLAVVGKAQSEQTLLVYKDGIDVTHAWDEEGKRILFGPKHIKMRICVPHQTRELPKLLEARLRALDASDTAQSENDRAYLAKLLKPAKKNKGKKKGSCNTEEEFLGVQHEYSCFKRHLMRVRVTAGHRTATSDFIKNSDNKTTAYMNFQPEPRDQNVCVRGSRFITFRLRNELDESVIAAKCIASSGEVLFEGARVNTSGRYGEINLSDEATKKQWDEGIKMLISNLNVVKDSGPICTASIVLERKLTSDSTKLFDISLHWHDDPPGKCYCKPPKEENRKRSLDEDESDGGGGQNPEQPPTRRGDYPKTKVLMLEKPGTETLQAPSTKPGILEDSASNIQPASDDLLSLLDGCQESSSQSPKSPLN